MRILLALSWKLGRLVLRKWLATIFILTLPLLLLALAVAINSYLPPPNRVASPTIFQRVSKGALKEELVASKIVYACDDSFPSEMRAFADKLMAATLQELGSTNRPIQLMHADSPESVKSILIEDFITHVFGWGVIFHELTDSALSYTLREASTRDWKTDRLFPALMSPGPMRASESYVSSGFLSIQIAINDAYARQLKLDVHEWSLEEFPYGPFDYYNDLTNVFFEYFLYYVVYFAFLAPFTVALSDIVREKASGIKEKLRLSGVDSWMIFLAWFIHYYLLSHAGILGIVFFFRMKLKSGLYLQFTDAFLLYCFVGLFCINSLCLVAAIASFFNDVKFAIPVFLFLTIFFHSLLVKQSDSVGLFPRFLTTLLPAGGLRDGIATITNFERSRERIHFGRLFSRPPSEEGSPLAFSISGMLTGCLLYLFIAYYVNSVKPGNHGIAKPWHFLYSEARAKIQGKKPNVTEEKLETNNALFEKISSKLPVGVDVKQLTKRFGKFTAVDNLSISILKNQITVLLGHNGAGKTTLMSMIAGIYSPTSGAIISEGQSIHDNVKQFRKILGYCPQDNTLSPDMSVWEHLVFFSLVRGFTYRGACENAVLLLNKFGIDHKKNSSVKNLSGGMKRKLCLAVALCGDSKSFKGNRTVVITTHSMEEADVLGDRLAIMVNGKLKCYGTPRFLKKLYGDKPLPCDEIHILTDVLLPSGAGYQLTVFCRNPSQTDDVANLTSRIITDSSVSSKDGSRIVFQLPSNDVENFPRLFRELESQYGNNIQVGVACSKVDDLFLKVQQEEGVSASVKDFEMPVSEWKTDRPFYVLVPLQVYAIILKKFIWSIKNWNTLCLSLIVFPIVLTYLCVYLPTIEGNAGSSVSRLMKLSEYGSTTAVFSGNQNASLYAESVRYIENEKSKVLRTNSNVIEELLKQCEENEGEYRASMIVAAQFSNKSVTALYSSLAVHAAPIAVDFISHSYLGPRKIFTYNHPIETVDERELCDRNSVYSYLEDATIWFTLLGFMLLITPLYFTLYPHSDRVCQMKHLQLMTGLSPFSYWVSVLIMDFALWTYVVGLILAVIFISDGTSTYAQCDFIGSFIVLLALFGWSVIPFMYLISFSAKRTGWILVLGFITPVAAGTLCLISPLFVPPETPHGDKIRESLMYVFFCVPWLPFISAFKTLFFNYVTHSQCAVCQASDDLCARWMDATWLEKYDFPNELYFLAGDGFLYLLILLLIDWNAFKILTALIASTVYGSIKPDAEPADRDVLEEKQKAAEMLQDEKPECVLSANSLGKKYSPRFVAVGDVSFVVMKGECFGLLGVNGAGKTTTFNMLTARVRPSRGNAYIDGYNVKWKTRSYLRRLGYCPQLDGLDHVLSARQLLHFFCRLRGVRRSDLFSVTEKWIQVFGMQDIGDRPCGVYSGGNKRKLSAAIAIIGDFPVILLDEPTTGVDAVIRRKMWEILKRCQSVGRSVVITSHSMDECEALSTKLTVMVKGYMKCIGPVPYLKSKYGRGYSLTLKLSPNISLDEKQDIKNAVQSKFGDDSTLKEEYIDSLTYTIGIRAVPRWSAMFQTSNDLKNRYSKIEDYSVSDISLEQIFLSFASMR